MTTETSHTRWFQHKGVRYQIRFIRRPFREGLEAVVRVGDRELRVAELGLGEKALIAKMKVLIDAT